MPSCNADTRPEKVGRIAARRIGHTACKEVNGLAYRKKTRYKGRLLVTGALAGLANGFFGAGGGLFLVPLLTGWAGLEERRAFATSVAIIFPLSVVSVFVYLQKGDIRILGNLPYLVGGAIGGVIGGKIFQKVKMVWLRRVFGVLILYGGVRALLLL